jgi:hypothetical protein
MTYGIEDDNGVKEKNKVADSATLLKNLTEIDERLPQEEQTTSFVDNTAEVIQFAEPLQDTA